MKIADVDLVGSRPGIVQMDSPKMSRRAPPGQSLAAAQSREPTLASLSLDSYNRDYEANVRVAGWSLGKAAIVSREAFNISDETFASWQAAGFSSLPRWRRHSPSRVKPFPSSAAAICRYIFRASASLWKCACGQVANRNRYCGTCAARVQSRFFAIAKSSRLCTVIKNKSMKLPCKSH
jgi:hypothetical protein